MNRRSPARVLTALVLAAGIALGTAGTAGALSPDADPPGQGRPGGAATMPAPPPADAAGVAAPAAPGGTEAAGAIPCPVADPAKPTTPDPDPKVTNPGPAPVDPCTRAEDPAPGPNGDPPAEQPAPPVEEPAPSADQAGPHAAAPTPALRTVATALTTTMNGVSALVHVPAGLDVGTVEITVFFGTEVRTQNYNRATGSYLPYDFQHLDGRIRTENLSIVLLEAVPGGRPRRYEISATVTVEPMFDISLSEPVVDIDGQCDWPYANGPDPIIDWIDADGVRHRYVDPNEFLAPGRVTHVEGFAMTVHRVSMNRGLTRPTFEWEDEDWFDIGHVGQNALPRGNQLLPRYESPAGLRDTELAVSETHAESNGDDCIATFTYVVTYHPVF